MFSFQLTVFNQMEFIRIGVRKWKISVQFFFVTLLASLITTKTKLAQQKVESLLFGCISVCKTCICMRRGSCYVCACVRLRFQLTVVVIY